MGLFAASGPASSGETDRPLAERLRPRTLADFSGQEHLLGPGKPLRALIEKDASTSLILWGPPGVGKTTLAKIIAAQSSARFVEFSAVLSGIKEIKEVMAQAERAGQYGERTLLFVDEIHRFNKAQQDAFLPFVERGSIRLIGATTENPSFEVNAALLSRCRVFTLRALPAAAVARLLRAALEGDAELLAMGVRADDDALALLADYASGDVRQAYNSLEVAVRLAAARGSALAQDAGPSAPPVRLRSGRDDSSGAVADGVLTRAVAAEALQQRVLMYDKSGEEHYNLISALHKSVRNSDADAALYWLARMLGAGEDSMYIARRVVRMAVEDIGLAAPEALNLCLSARDAVHFLGQPEGDLALAQAVVYLALAPKSNALYTGFGAAQHDVEQTAQEPVPLHLRNAPTRLMKEMEYGKGYQYAHHVSGKVAAMDCLPEGLRDRRYYRPTGEGRERLLKERMEQVMALRSGGRDNGAGSD